MEVTNTVDDSCLHFHIPKWHLSIVVLKIRNVRPLLCVKPLCRAG